ncbi:MAG: PorV/PorQ family protein [Elusimicrobiota bacterium]|jgi:hypothetical protein
MRLSPPRGFRRLALALALSGAGAPAVGNDNVGTTAAEVLKVGNGVRPVAMGAAYTALARDLSGGLFWNPAGLGFLPRHSFEASYNASYQGINQGYAAYGRGFEKAGGLAVGISYLNAGAQLQTEANPNGGYTVLGSFTPTSWVVSAGYGATFLHDRIGAGVVAKQVSETFEGVRPQPSQQNDTLSAVAVDMGVLARFFDKRLSLGAAYQNLGTRLGGYDLPGLFRTGLGLEISGYAASLDLLAPRDDGLGYGIGMEYTVLKILSFRAGYDSALKDGSRGTVNVFNGGLSTGIGVRILDLGFDYAFVPYGALGNAHRMSISMRWGAAAGQKPGRARLAAVSADSHPGGALAAEPEAAPGGRACPAEGAGGAKTEAEAEVERRFQKFDELLRAREPEDAARVLNYSELGLGLDDPRQIRYLERWGALMQQTGNQQAAKSCYADAIHIAARLRFRGPSVAAAYLGLGDCLLSAGEVSGAKGAFLRALQECPSSGVRRAAEARLDKLSAAAR